MISNEDFLNKVLESENVYCTNNCIVAQLVHSDDSVINISVSRTPSLESFLKQHGIFFNSKRLRFAGACKSIHLT